MRDNILLRTVLPVTAEDTRCGNKVRGNLLTGLPLERCTAYITSLNQHAVCRARLGDV